MAEEGEGPDEAVVCVWSLVEFSTVVEDNSVGVDMNSAVLFSTVVDDEGSEIAVVCVCWLVEPSIVEDISVIVVVDSDVFSVVAEAEGPEILVVCVC